MAKKTKKDEHEHPELKAPSYGKIVVPLGIKGLNKKTKGLPVTEEGKKSTTPASAIYRQGFQRGFTAGASVRIMRKEAGKKHAWHVPATTGAPLEAGVPIPKYVAGVWMKKAYLKGFLDGWTDSNKPEPKATKGKTKSPHH